MSTVLQMMLLLFYVAMVVVLWSSACMSSAMGFIFFLIYISGLLVTFSYLASLSPNTSTPVALILVSFCMLLTPSETAFMENLHGSEFVMMRVFKDYNSILFLIVASVLLVVMIAVVVMIYSTRGPQRGSVYQKSFEEAFVL